MFPPDRRYTKDHEWVLVQGDQGTVGITDYAQKQLGDVVYLELPELGRSLKAQETFGTVESVKAVSDLFAPISGEVLEVNSSLVAKPEKINSDPHGEAWMIRVKLADPSQLAGLLDAAAYQAYVDSEAK